MQDIDLCQSCRAIEFEKYFRKSDTLEDKTCADRKDFPYTIHFPSFTMLEESSSRCVLCRLTLQSLRSTGDEDGQGKAVIGPDAVVYVSVYPMISELNTMNSRVFTLEFSVDQLDCDIRENVEGAEDYLFVKRLGKFNGKIRIDTSDGMLFWQQIHPLANRKLHH